MNNQSLETILLIVVGIPFGSVLLISIIHELGHILAGLITNCEIKELIIGLPFWPKITFWLFGTKVQLSPWLIAAGVRIEYWYKNIWEKIFIFLGGPIANLIVGLLILILTRPDLEYLTQMALFKQEFLETVGQSSPTQLLISFAMLNILSAIFSLFPFLPLDGGQIVFVLIDEITRFNLELNQKLLNIFEKISYPGLFLSHVVVVGFYLEKLFIIPI